LQKISTTVYTELLEIYNKKFETEIFPLLMDNGLIHRNTGLVHRSFPKRLDRIELQKESIQSKIFLLQQHMTSGKKVEDFDKVIMFDLICMMSQAILSYFKIFKSYLGHALDLEQLGIRTDNPMYDQMVNQLGDFKNDGGIVFHKAGLRSFFNVDLRNALAHDSWWLNNAEFTYEEHDGTEISLSIGEL